MKLNQIKQEQVYYMWDLAEDAIANALEESVREQQLAGIKGRVFAGMSQLWNLEAEGGKYVAWATTTLYTGDGISSILQLNTANAEDLQKILPFLDQIELYARELGARYIEIVGREGWKRVLRPYGFQHNYTSVIKPVTKEVH